MNFTSIDFETANPKRCSACSVGLVKVKDFKIVDTFYEVFLPPTGVNSFAPWNTKIHGISSKDMTGKRDFKSVLFDLTKFVGDDVLVAHNAPFDKSVLESSANEVNYEVNFPFLCTLKLARERNIPLEKLNLQSLSNYFGIKLDNHHNALDDAIACAKIAIRLLCL